MFHYSPYKKFLLITGTLLVLGYEYTIKSQPSVVIKPVNNILSYDIPTSNWILPSTVGWGPIAVVVYRNGLRQIPGVDYTNNDNVLVPITVNGNSWDSGDIVVVDFVKIP